MNKKLVLYNSGRIAVFASFLMLLPAVVSLIYRDGQLISFLIPFAIMLLFGILCTRFKPKNKSAYAKEGFVTVAIMWLLLSVFGSLPFVISREIPSFIDAFFETVSGFTTTGASILEDVEALPHSMLFWRSFTHWVGGMGVLALALAILPTDKKAESAKDGSIHILKAESPGPTFGKLVSKLKYNVRILYLIYTVITAIEVILLLLGGMGLFDSLLNSFATAGTGGFAIKNASIAHYDSVYIDYVIGIFMLLFGVNFNIYYFMLTGRLLKILKSEELRWYLIIVATAVISITLNILSQFESLATAFRYAFFQVSSIITTTGFVTANYDLWPTFSKFILVLLMFMGACASSTGGGLKISRVIILFKSAICEIRNQINPREIHTVKCDETYLTPVAVASVGTYFGIYMAILFVSSLVVALDGESFATTFSSVVACLNNIGPGLDKVGAVGNYSDFSVLSKLVLSFDMLAGRLEILPLLIALSPSVWKK